MRHYFAQDNLSDHIRVFAKSKGFVLPLTNLRWKEGENAEVKALLRDAQTGGVMNGQSISEEETATTTGAKTGKDISIGAKTSISVALPLSLPLVMPVYCSRFDVGAAERKLR